jgi:hypothetical protein
VNQLEFIRQHLEHTDLPRLLLSAHRYPEVDVPAAVAQIEALRKVRDKIPAWYDPTLQMPPRLSVEQASSALAAEFKTRFFEGKKMADLTGGMGVDSFFWAKKYAEVHYVEQDERLVAAAQYNFERLGATNVRCHHATAQEFLARGASRDFDLIYLDPARRDQQQRKIFQLADCQPDVVTLIPQLMARGQQVLLKTAPLLDLDLAVRQLGRVARIWVVALDGECKEVLYHLTDAPPADPPIVAVDLGRQEVQFELSVAIERAAEVVYAAPQAWLYEPNAALLKAGAFRSFAQHYGLAKLHVNTHLYTSDERVEGVAGRTFRVRAVCRYDRKAVLAALGGVARANVATRNFPDSVAHIRQKLGLADGGDTYLFAATLADGTRAIVIGEKV